jgi:hypothetical protein
LTIQFDRLRNKIIEAGWFTTSWKMKVIQNPSPNSCENLLLKDEG